MKLSFQSIMICGALIALPVLGQPASSGFVQGRLLMQRQTNVSVESARSAVVSRGATLRAEIAQIRVHVVDVPEPALPAVQDALNKTGLFTFVERDGIGRAHILPNDTSYGSQWHLPKIQAPSAWDLSTGATSVPVAVIDTGVDPAHADLSAKLVSGWSYLNGSSNTADVQGHGTAVSGTTAAATNNLLGVAGVSWGSTIMPLQALDSTGSGSYSNFASAVTWAADRGAKVINMSFGGTYNSSTLQSAINYAWSKGVVIVASAGNSGNSTPNYPAACDNVISVSATTSSDALASWSSFGNWVDISAPGENILTTLNGGGYGGKSGTSFSAPVVAGVAALLFAYKPTLSNAAVVDLLTKNADDLGAAGYDQYYGWGRVNALRALQAAQYVTVSAPPTVAISSPGSGQTVSGMVNVSGTASSSSAIKNVELYVDGGLAGSGTNGIFSFSWNSTSVTNGSHSLTVKAYDTAGLVGQSSVTVSVNNVVAPDLTPPSVAITSPANGTVFSAKTANVKVKANASDNIGVTQVVIYVDGVQKATLTASPYSYTWSMKGVAAGSHTVKATAWDAAGNSASSQVSVTKQ